MSRNPSIDLHVHSDFSDGSLSPEEVAGRAARNNVAAVAFTDHDTLDGWERKLAACREHGLECVCGVELSCEFEEREAHILSLFADPESACRAELDILRREREKRLRIMLERLNGMGIAISMEDVPAEGRSVYGRPHLARALVEKGVVRNVGEAFARYLHDGSAVYVKKVRLSAAAGIDLAKRLGGAAVLAHPGVSGFSGELDAFRKMGLDGIEAYHPKHGGECVASLLRYCREWGMPASGGSDFHSPGDGPDIGSTRVPLDLLEPLRAAAFGKG